MKLLSVFGGGLWFILLILGAGTGYSWFRFIKTGFKPALYAAIVLTVALFACALGMWAER